MLRSLLLALALLSLGSPAEAQFGWFGSSKEPSPSEQAGTKSWWKKHKKEAVFVPRQGYQVPGYEGYFDGNGVPISASVDEQTVRLTNEQEEAGLLPGLDPKRAVASVREAAGYGESEAAARALFNEGVALFEAKKYGSAAGKFSDAVGRWPGTDLAAKGLFNLGESHFFDKKYSAATDAYTKLLEEHPSTPRLDETVNRLWVIAQYWDNSHFGDESSWGLPFDANFSERTRPGFDTIGHAIRMYESIRLNDPTGPRADDAIMATAEVYRKQKRFADADYHYTLLRQEYPRSRHQFDAHLRGLEAKLARYLGPNYDGTPLREAERLEELTRANFSGRLDDAQRESLREVRAKIARAIEQRDLRMAQYYEGTGHYGAATYYLKQFTEEFPDSPASKEAQERIVEHQDKPASPAVPLKSLVELLPENKRFEAIRTAGEAASEAQPTAPSLTPGEGRTLVAERPGETSRK